MTRRPCPHGRQRYHCKECGGKGVCEHGRQRPICKECGGRQICVHGRQRYYCKDCGGTGVCPHGRQRKQCKDCGGSQICVHGRRRGVCKDCGGGAFCVHGRQRRYCKDCGGAGVCVHGRRRDRCKEALCIERHRQAQLMRGGRVGHSAAAAAPPPRAAPSCFCGTDDGLPPTTPGFDGGWLLCGACVRWCHTECVGLSEAEAEARGGYTCPRCRAPPADDDYSYTELSSEGEGEDGGCEGEVPVRALPASWPPLWRVAPGNE